MFEYMYIRIYINNKIRTDRTHSILIIVLIISQSAKEATSEPESSTCLTL